MLKNPDKHCTFCGKILSSESIVKPPVFYEFLLYELNGVSDQLCHKFVCCECTSNLKKDMK